MAEASHNYLEATATEEFQTFHPWNKGWKTAFGGILSTQGGMSML